jgi:hypothetical protein
MTDSTSSPEEGRRISDLTRYAYDKLAEQGKLSDIEREGWDRFWARIDPDGRLTGGQGPRQSRVPLPVEVDAIIGQAVAECRQNARMGPSRKCLATPPGQVAGEPIYCDRLLGHTTKIKHRNRETGFSWWGSK